MQRCTWWEREKILWPNFSMVDEKLKMYPTSCGVCVGLSAKIKTILRTKAIIEATGKHIIVKALVISKEEMRTDPVDPLIVSIVLLYSVASLCKSSLAISIFGLSSISVASAVCSSMGLSGCLPAFAFNCPSYSLAVSRYN